MTNTEGIRFFAIALVSTKGTELDSVRIFDTKSNQFMNATIDSVKKQISNGLQIGNIMRESELSNLTNLSRKLPVIRHGKLCSNNMWTIIASKADESGDLELSSVVDCMGNVQVVNGTTLGSMRSSGRLLIDPRVNMTEFGDMDSYSESLQENEQVDDRVSKSIDALTNSKDFIGKNGSKGHIIVGFMGKYDSDKEFKEFCLANGFDEAAFKSMYNNGNCSDDIASKIYSIAIGLTRKFSDKQASEIDEKLKSVEKNIVKYNRGVTQEMLNEKNKEGLTVKDLIARIQMNMMMSDPFRYVIYKRLKMVPTLDVDRMATDGVNILFNPMWITTVSNEEVYFIVLHEMEHIIRCHVTRGLGKDQNLSNTAGDLWINKYLCESLGIDPLDSNKLSVKLKNDIQTVRYPYDSLYWGAVDPIRDSFESIYKVLKDSKQGQGQGQGQSQGQGQGQSQTQAQGQGQGQSQTQAQGQGQGQSQGQSQGQGQGQVGSVKVTDSDDGNGKDIEITLPNGDVIKGKLPDDLVKSDKTADMSNEEIQNKAKQAISAALQEAKLTNNWGNGGCGDLERQYGPLLRSEIPWKRTLEAYFIKSTKKENSFMTPDKRYKQYKLNVPGPRKSSKDALGKCAIGVDVSGSITDKIVHRIMSEIAPLVKKYKAECDVIFWSTEVHSMCKVKNYRDFLRINVNGTGGTDVNCFFEKVKELERGSRKYDFVIVFTDGYFGSVYEEYTHRRDTIWAITREDTSSFENEIGFGKVTRCWYE